MIMKPTIGFLLCIAAFCLLAMRSSAQDKPLLPDKFPKRAFTPSLSDQSPSNRAPRYSIPGKRASQYAADDWGRVIDSTWGPGQSAVDQLNVFDTFWGAVDRQWAGFPNLSINWDSLRTVYRPQIGSGLSRGRFSGLMTRMWLALQEMHTSVTDEIVDTTFGGSPDFIWQYKRGVPLLVIGTSWWDLLGAPVTPMPDSSGLVYRVASGNPLGLEPGDLVLGYEGIPWKRLYGRLLDYGLPVSRYWSIPGSTPESNTEAVLSAVGWNWGMFDTIDVVKYSTGDTLHLPTAPLTTVTPTVWASDQVPVAGVPMPQGCGTEAVSWGVIQGTNIGYVYAWDWTTASNPVRFKNAIYDLLNNKKVGGLVIDFRMNLGGDPSNADGGLSQLFNFDPASNVSFAVRNGSTDHLGFDITSTWQFARAYDFTPTLHPFDRPIAVLIGPACLSGGDFTAFWMRFHPMARSFGKPTNGGFVAGSFANSSFPGGWRYSFPTSIGYSNVLGDGYLIHKGVQPDEEVWLTRDGVAKGKDDVVERALAWIRSLTYAHDVAFTRSYTGHHLDSVFVTARLTNPLNHSAALTAIVTDTAGVVCDSVLLFNDGKHHDGLAGDSVWGCRIPLPSNEAIFKVSVRTDDITQGSFRKLPNIGGVATAGPLTLDSVGVSKSRGGAYQVTPYVRNNGSSFTVRGASVTLRCDDPWVSSTTTAVVGLPDIPPGATTGSTSPVGVYDDPTRNPGYFNLKAEISIGGVTYWTDSTKIKVPGTEGVGREEALPVRYALEQNYPNPFNPSTTIRYSLPHKSQVLLAVYNTLGQQVVTLVRGQQEAGSYEVKFDGSNLASGVYFYRLQAGGFLEAKKLVIAK